MSGVPNSAAQPAPQPQELQIQPVEGHPMPTIDGKPVGQAPAREASRQPTPIEPAPPNPGKGTAQKSFNEARDGLQSEKKLEQTKAEVEPSKPYQSKVDGKVYESEQAKAAAKNLDQAQTRPEPVREQQSRTTSHHAPAPAPSWAANDPERGKATETTQTAAKNTFTPEKSPAEQAKHDYAIALRDQARQSSASQNSEPLQQVSQSQDVGR